MQPWCLARGWGKGRGWGGTQQSFIQGGSSPRSNPSPFYIPFLTNRYPFHIPSTDKWHLFHIPTCSLEFCIFLTAVNALYFKYKFIIKQGNFFDFFKAFILLRSFDRPKWQISIPFQIRQPLKSLPFQGNVKQDDLQRRFLAQHSNIVATLFKMVTTLFQYCNAVLR